MTTRKTRIRAALVTATALAAAASVTAGVSSADSQKSVKTAHAPKAVRAEQSDSKPTKSEIAGLFDGWNDALQTGDADKVADRYASDAVLLPTVSNKVRTDRAGIVDYFQHFLEDKPVGKKIDTYINILDDNSAIDTGVYEFTLTDPDTGDKSTVKARYTYEYEKRGGKWLIVNHHSSKMPEG